jgi:hypothetical protein
VDDTAPAAEAAAVALALKPERRASTREAARESIMAARMQNQEGEEEGRSVVEKKRGKNE